MLKLGMIVVLSGSLLTIGLVKLGTEATAAPAAAPIAEAAAPLIAPSAAKKIKIGVSVPAADHGWTAGVGVEYKWRRNWVVGLEYDYYRFDTENHSNTTIGTTGPGVGLPTFYSQNVSANLSTVTARLSYLFNPGAVAAKY